MFIVCLRYIFLLYLNIFSLKALLVIDSEFRKCLWYSINASIDWINYTCWHNYVGKIQMLNLFWISTSHGMLSF